MAYAMVHDSVPLIRVHVRRQLCMWRWSGDIENAVLVGTELVTNAIRHGHIAGHLLELRLALLEDRGLLVDVSDPVAEFPRSDVLIAAEREDEQGRGLFLVCALGAEVSWFLRQEGGKTVRAHLPVLPEVQR
ncbi:ATP-binding protein [Streptomyces sp. NPDC059009]|uniref:ATP-binding protein n=1 Tax=Streptomyces sp. NPDC059009 TaxID=3346694 RepID=UPI00369F843A